jgi:transposase InsO family protein
MLLTVDTRAATTAAETVLGSWLRISVSRILGPISYQRLADFSVDVYPRRIAGWNVAATLRAEILPLQALDMAAWDAGGDLTGLTHHSDNGSNYMATVYTDHVVELGAKPSTGTVGDSYDNALAEAINNLYKTELIRQLGPWRTVEQVAQSRGVGQDCDRSGPPGRMEPSHPRSA